MDQSSQLDVTSDNPGAGLQRRSPPPRSAAPHRRLNDPFPRASVIVTNNAQIVLYKINYCWSFRNVSANSEAELVSLQTLSRGLRVLEMVAQTDDGLFIADIADALGVHRAIAYRLVATLEKHLLLIRDKSGRIFLGGGIVGLAARVEPQMREMSRPLLRDMAEKTRATAFMCVGHGEDCVVIQVVEPAGV